MPKRLMVALCILSSARSFLQWLWGRRRGTLRGELGDRFKHRLGWFDPEMAPHWLRVETPGDGYHDRKNVTTEWVRLDAQRAAKFFAFLTVTGWGAALLLGLGLALTLII